MVHEFRPDGAAPIRIVLDDRAGVHRKAAFEQSLSILYALADREGAASRDVEIRTLTGGLLRVPPTPEGMVELLTFLAGARPSRRRVASLPTRPWLLHGGHDLDRTGLAARHSRSGLRDRGRRRMTRLRRWAPDVGLACVSLIAAASLTRLLQGGLGGPATGPVLVAAAVGSTVPALLAAWRAPVALRMLLGTLAVGLVSLWTSSPGSTTFGVPTARTWHVLAQQLRQAHPILVSLRSPAPVDPGDRAPVGPSGRDRVGAGIGDPPLLGSRCDALSRAWRCSVPWLSWR